MKFDFSSGVYVPLNPPILHIMKRNTNFSCLHAVTVHRAGNKKGVKQTTDHPMQPTEVHGLIMIGFKNYSTTTVLSKVRGDRLGQGLVLSHHSEKVLGLDLVANWAPSVWSLGKGCLLAL